VSSRTYSPQIAVPTGRPRLKLRIVSCASFYFESTWIRRASQRKDTEIICEAVNPLQGLLWCYMHSIIFTKRRE
jgi:hypothetical protein